MNNMNYRFESSNIQLASQTLATFSPKVTESSQAITNRYGLEAQRKMLYITFVPIIYV